MLEARLTITIPGLEQLAAALAGRAESAFCAPRPAPPATPPQPVYAAAPVAPLAPPPMTTAPVYDAAPVAPLAPPPMTTAPVVPTAVPTTAAPGFTVDQIANAGAELVQAGKMQELLALLAQYGVQAVTELTPEQIGPFATALRGMGARI